MWGRGGTGREKSPSLSCMCPNPEDTRRKMNVVPPAGVAALNEQINGNQQKGLGVLVSMCLSLLLAPRANDTLNRNTDKNRL